MPYRNTEFTQGQYYHIYNRGAGKSKIFFRRGQLPIPIGIDPEVCEEIRCKRNRLLPYAQSRPFPVEADDR